MNDRIVVPMSKPPKDRIMPEHIKRKQRRAMRGKKKSAAHKAATSAACKGSLKRFPLKSGKKIDKKYRWSAIYEAF